MARTPTRLMGPAQIATGPATIFTAAGETKNIIRHIHVQNPSGSPVTLTLSIGTDAANKRILDAFSVPAQAPGVTANVLDIWCYYILVSGEIIQAAAGTNNVLVITINGDVDTL